MRNEYAYTLKDRFHISSTSILRHGLSKFQDSKYPIRINSVGACLLFVMSVPQLDIQPLRPTADVPGALVVEAEIVRKSAVVPHCPQMLQQALSGHGLSDAKATDAAGFAVPGTCGPQTVFTTAAGIG